MALSAKILTNYAKALFQSINLKKGQSNENDFAVSKITYSTNFEIKSTPLIVGEELSLIRALFISSKKMQLNFQNPTYSEQQKLEILFTIFPGLSTTLKSFLKVLKEKNHLAYLPEISDAYQKFLVKYQNSIHLRLVLASPIQESLGNTFLKNLKKLTKADQILLTVAYNPRLLGGFILEYNSLAIDASILKEFSRFFTEL